MRHAAFSDWIRKRDGNLTGKPIAPRKLKKNVPKKSIKKIAPKLLPKVPPKVTPPEPPTVG